LSTLAYGALTSRRMQQEARTSTAQNPPGLQTYVDGLAALVPAEVLVLHAAILAVTTSTENTSKVSSLTAITQPTLLKISFFGLVAVSMALYVAGRLGVVGGVKSSWVWPWDLARLFIPPLAFVGWTMIQTVTAFDALPVNWSMAVREVVALFGAVVLATAATALAYKADSSPPG
jgi:hypothetical protein